MHREPRAQPVTGTTGDPMRWTEVVGPLAEAGTYWLSTTRADGRPHAMPVLGVWVDDALHFASGPATRKSRNLAGNASCSITASRSGLDLVVEGDAAPVSDTQVLQRVAAAYRSKYGWSPSAHEGALHADAGAPTAGPPPWRVYRVEVVKVFALPSDGDFTPTRWSF
ncbi:pyridoxamine 5'-phosphate oxidase family protein [Qaidamihabitans albus]|uniref:pyridoxamine 5'-phosphate oxidase family protein n=1 Tax=Qaidamihabitans albus TaxID=2795733 RepID=UPI0018F20042|nr:pyridoxamine 5'-phosphate oxidase family protein [Qaidamihabitans albus]